MSRSVSVEENIFSLEQVEVTYTGTRGPRRVLQDVSFALAPGQRIGLYGPNGSGKTTLFRCITGLVRPSKGPYAARWVLCSSMLMISSFSPRYWRM